MDGLQQRLWDTAYDFVCGALGQTGGFTPLFVASQNGHVEVVRILAGANASLSMSSVRTLGWCCCWQSPFFSSCTSVSSHKLHTSIGYP